MSRYDAAIVGAGPAGSALALLLSEQGRRVLLIDARSFPREKVCGEGVMPHGIALLKKLGLGPAIEDVGQPFRGIRYRLAGGDEVTAEAPFPGGARGIALRRLSIDEALARKAAAAPGVEARFGQALRSIEWGQGEHVLELDGERLNARVIIGADGARSFVRRSAGLDGKPPRRRRFAVRGHFEHAAIADPDRPVEVVMGAGYEMYLTPVAADATGVILTIEGQDLARIQGRPEAALREALARSPGFSKTLAAAELVSRVQATGPLGQKARRVYGDGLLLVGDAAGALDPITGEGFSLALDTAFLAAETLEGCYQSGDFSARALKPYAKKRRRARRDVAALTAIVLTLASRPALARRVIKNLARFPKTFEKLLGITAGSSPITAVGPRDALRIVVGV